MEDMVRQKTESGEIPGVVLLARDTHGKVDYTRAYGVRSTKMGSSRPPMTPSTIIRIASASKLITSVMCLQCVEQGLLDLDVDLTSLLPEVGNFEILTGFTEDGEPETHKRNSPLTLRHMLSHSSGISYDGMDPLLVKYREYQGLQLQPPGDKVEDRFTYPLAYEPGEGWAYGPNLEWAARLMENVRGGQPLEDFMQENICKPLGITDMTFRLQERPDLLAIRGDLSERGDDAEIHHSEEAYWHHDPVDPMGGMGIFTSPSSYMKVMHSLLLNDGKLLNSRSNGLLFEPQLTPRAVSSLMDIYEIEEMNTKMGALLPMGVKKNHALGGMLIEEDLDGKKWRSKGTMLWSGLPNVYWFIDREAGLCGLYASQLKPPGDELSMELARAFERAMYEKLHA